MGRSSEYALMMLVVSLIAIFVIIPAQRTVVQMMDDSANLIAEASHAR